MNEYTPGKKQKNLKCKLKKNNENIFVFLTKTKFTRKLR